MIDPDDIPADDRFPADVPFPAAVLVAGVLWLLFGGLTFLGGLLNMALVAAGENPGGAPGGCCGLLFGIAFVSAGWNSVKGTAKDTRGNAVGSLAVGAIYLGLTVVLAVVGLGALPGNGPGGAGLPPEEELVMLLTALAVAMFGLILLTAGVLALVGRRQYLDWREVAMAPHRAPRDRGDGR